MINLIVGFINEFKSYFVPEKIRYEIKGECLQCGKCCNYMYSFDTYSEKEFKFMQLLYPAYKRFFIKGQDEDGNFIFGCKHVSEDGKCTVYKKRLRMCKAYPHKHIMFPAKLHEGCGYKVMKKNFEDYLKN